MFYLTRDKLSYILSNNSSIDIDYFDDKSRIKFVCNVSYLFLLNSHAKPLGRKVAKALRHFLFFCVLASLREAIPYQT